VGTGYFDRVSRAIGGDSPTLALPGSTEAAQFEAEAATATRFLA
jgi:isocitrate lyase